MCRLGGVISAQKVLFSCISRFVVFVTVFGFSHFYPYCNHLCLDCLVFHLVCKAI